MRPNTPEPDEKPAQPAGATWKKDLSDYAVVNKLIKRMGGKKGFDPMPPAQHQWQMAPGQPPLYRMWSWLCAHTIHWGHRSEYAVNVLGETRTIQDMAEDLGIDEKNCYSYWAKGEQLGLWRKGTKGEGVRRLYLCGEVVASGDQAKGEEEANENICTKGLGAYIVNQVNKLPQEKQVEFWSEYSARQELRKATQAELIAASRLIFDQDDDTQFEKFGLHKIRQDRKPDAPPEEFEARQARLTGLVPHLQTFVQMVAVSVQKRDEAVYEDSVQSKTTNATLLEQRNLREGQKRAAVSAPDAPGVRSRTAPGKGKKSIEQLHTVNLVKLTGREKEAEDLLFSEIARMQQAYPHTDFSRELISRENKSDQLLVRRVLNSVGVENMTDFLLRVAGKFKGLDRNSLGALPARSPEHAKGPRSLGLILTWADDYRRKMDESARADAAVSSSRRANEIANCQAILAPEWSDPINPGETNAMKQAAAELLAFYRGGGTHAAGGGQ